MIPCLKRNNIKKGCRLGWVDATMTGINFIKPKQGSK